jgi:hypothetical protein
MKKLIPILFACSASAHADLKFEKSEGSMKVTDDGKLITEYRTDSKVPYLYPLLSPSGANVTRHWPTKEGVADEATDHPHHRSMWMGHGAVNGADFWANKGEGNPTIVHKGFEQDTKATPDSVSFTVNLEWQDHGKKLIDEKRAITVRKINPTTNALEFTCTLTAAEDVTFGDTKEGMFAFRMDRTLRLKGKQAKSHIIDSNGVTDGDTWGKRADWVAYYGPDEKGEPVVAAMFDHPKNFRYPTYWHVRDYGLVAANPFGIHDFEGKKDQTTLGNHELKKGESMTFRYSIVIHHGDLKSAELGKLWKAFSN